MPARVLCRACAARAVSCSYRTEDGTGIAGIDYEEATGTLEFADQEACKGFSASCWIGSYHALHADRSRDPHYHQASGSRLEFSQWSRAQPRCFFSNKSALSGRFDTNSVFRLYIEEACGSQLHAVFCLDSSYPYTRTELYKFCVGMNTKLISRTGGVGFAAHTDGGEDSHIIQ